MQGSKALKVLVMNTQVVAHQTFALRILTWLQEVIGYSGQYLRLNSLDSTELPASHRILMIKIFVLKLITDISICLFFVVELMKSVFDYFVCVLESRGNYSATLNDVKLVRWPLMGGLLHLVQQGGDWAGLQPAQAPHCCTKCNSLPING